VLNFALGQLLLVAGCVFTTLLFFSGDRYGLSLIGVVVCGALFGGLLYLTLLRKMTGQPPLVVVMFTIMLGIILQALTGVIWGTASRNIVNPVSQAGIQIVPGAALSEFDIAIILCAVLVVAVVGVFVRYTPIGVAMRATAADPDLASYRGVNVVAVATTAWVISTAIAFLTGAIIGVRSTVDVSIVGIGFVGFAAILIGGMDSIVGAIVGAVVVALTQSVATSFLGGEWSEVSAYAVLLFMLVVRPYGLFGTPEFMRV
jgi:branched-chain amino acid transport system permease protein